MHIFTHTATMRPTDNDPKGNDPVDRDPTNAEIVHYLQRDSMHFCPVIGKKVGKNLTKFEFRTDFKGMLHCFEGTFLDMKNYKVLCTTTADDFDKYPRAKALKSLLEDVCFPSVEAFAVSCRNAMGDNTETFDLAGCIFIDNQCVDDIIDALDAKATEEDELAAEVKNLTEREKLLILEILMTFIYENADLRRE